MRTAFLTIGTCFCFLGSMVIGGLFVEWLHSRDQRLRDEVLGRELNHRLYQEIYRDRGHWN